jgi:hypothetical protein
MANPIQPFSGGGGYGSVIPQDYLGFTSGVMDKWKSEKDAKTEGILSSLSAVAGNLTGQPEMANTLFPSALGKYYQQASEAQGKAKAYEGLVKASPELFGLSSEQAKSFTDFASKLPPTAVPEFYQMALKGGMLQQEQRGQMDRTKMGISPQLSELELKKKLLEQMQIRTNDFIKKFEIANSLF